ncbi:MAG: hypothetical protein KDG50_09750 [Chromatiales bacterium]|nr:hypothetical protein [Chromatiales bacterium]
MHQTPGRQSLKRAGAGLVFALAALISASSRAVPMLADTALGTLELVAHDPLNLLRVDGLTFDSHGNLFAALEVIGNGGVSYIDKTTGTVVRLISNISGVDQIDSHPSGAFHFTVELTPAQTTGRVYRMDVTYDGSNTPQSATATSISTGATPTSNVEGLVTLTGSNAYGNAGDLLISEDLSNGRLLKLELAGNNATPTILVGAGAGLQRPEGMAFGDFGGAATPALYVSETLNDRILRVAGNGTTSVFALAPGSTLFHPDNLEFGFGGWLYVTEDPGIGLSRVLRYDANGNEQVVATGFNEPAGLAIDPATGDLYISEQSSQNVWRIRFASVPAPASLTLIALSLPLLRRWRAN